MAELDCRIVAMFTLALSLLFLAGVIFIRHHNHHNSNAGQRTSEALVVENPWNNDTESTSDGYSDTPDDSLITAIPQERNGTSSSPLAEGGFRVSESCLQCICEAATDCKPSKCAGGEMCGLFRISRPYWTDAGRPTLDSITTETSHFKDDDDEKKAYLLCVNNPFCAARTVNGYIGRYNRDCDEDGVIDCYDYTGIHIKGPRGCKNGDLPSIGRLHRCLKQFTAEE